MGGKPDQMEAGDLLRVSNLLAVWLILVTLSTKESSEQRVVTIGISGAYGGGGPNFRHTPVRGREGLIL